MIQENIRERLFEVQDLKYKDFSAKLIPNISPELVIGVRLPELRKLTKGLASRSDITDFLQDLPHKYLEEYHLHGFIISEIRDYDRMISHLDKLLPYIDNWATCDSLRPKAFAKNRHQLLGDIKRWINSGETYTIRFGIEALMCNFLDSDFKPEYLSLVAAVKSDEYYVNMMIAWFFATALAKQWDATIAYIDDNVLEVWVHNKTIQKALESYRITPEHKLYLRERKRHEQN